MYLIEPFVLIKHIFGTPYLGNVFLWGHILIENFFRNSARKQFLENLNILKKIYSYGAMMELKILGDDI